MLNDAPFSYHRSTISFLDRLARDAESAEEVTKYYNAMEKLYAEYNHAIEIENQAYFDNQKDEKEAVRIQEEMRKAIETKEIEKQKNRIEMVKISLRVIEILATVVLNDAPFSYHRSTENYRKKRYSY